jgi:radical SAM superfamily enzyme YgiQ (UPF0313 family)
MKNVLIVSTRCHERKIPTFVMWGGWAVASYLKRSIKDSDVVFLDEDNEDDFFEKFKALLPSRDTVGFTLTSMQIKFTLPLIKFIKTNYPGVRVVVGGIHPILFPDQDYGPLVDEVVTEDLPKDHFDYELMPKKLKEVFRSRAQIVTAFNCSFKCAFCVNSVRNCRYEAVPIERVKADIDYVVKEFNPKKIYFRDEHFFQDINRAKELVDYILEKNYKFNWDTNCRVTDFMPGRIDDAFFEKIVASGCKLLRFGVESGSQRLLNYLRKGQTPDQIRFAMKQCVKFKTNAACSMIIGVPGETEEDRRQSYKLIEDITGYGKEISILGPQIYRPYPGGILYEEIKKYGFKFPEKFEDWADYYSEKNNPIGEVLDSGIDYPWLTKKENAFMPYVFVVIHYGTNYIKEKSLLKKLIGYYINIFHWRTRWFGGPDLKLIMWARRKFF